MTFRKKIKIFSQTPLFRILLHIGFWVFYLSLPVWQYANLHTFSKNWLLLISILNLCFLLIYYPFAYYVVPKFFRLEKIHLFIFSIVLLYTVFFYFARGLEKYALANFTFNDYDKSYLTPASERNIFYLPEFLQIVIITAIPLSLKFMRRFYKLQDEKNDLSKMNTQLELDFLKSQINPHFLFNSLNNIYSLALQKNDKAPEMIIKLSDLMRYMLYDCNVEKNALSKEVTFMQDYIDLEKLRHGDDVTIDFQITGDMNSKKIPPLLLVPFIENAFKHGVNAQFSQSWVKFQLTADDHALHFRSSNNKPFNGNSINKKTGGIGIENTMKRLQLIYPDQYTLKITEESNIYKVSLDIQTI